MLTPQEFSRLLREKMEGVTGIQVFEVDGTLTGVVDKYKNERFGMSLRSLLLYAQIGDGSERIHGMFVVGPGFACGVGAFHRTDWCVHLIAPTGTQRIAYTHRIAKACQQISQVEAIYVRHVLPEDARSLEEEEFCPIGSRPWLFDAPAEDETFCHSRVDLNEVLIHDSRGLHPSDLRQGHSKEFRSKFRFAYRRFENFLERNAMRMEFRAMNDGDYDVARSIVERHFELLEKSGRAVGSTALDYQLLLRTTLPHSAGYLSCIGELKSIHRGITLPVSVFMGEQIGGTVGALYLTITRRDELVPQEIGATDPMGFTAIAQYAFARVFMVARQMGWQICELGGSETIELDRFKRQLGATEAITEWVVMDGRGKCQ